MGPSDTCFTFDHVANEIISQEKLFRMASLPMVENSLAGYKCCMFAYSQVFSICIRVDFAMEMASTV
jgi:kinesin family protein 15